jgi:thiol:disulfide interchange protein DsbA
MKERKLPAIFRALVVTLLLLPVMACAEKAADAGAKVEKVAMQGQAVEKLQKTDIAKLEPKKSASKVKTFVKDVHYAELFSPVPVSTAKGEVEVVEMFWYGCPHCFKLDPHLNKWHQNVADDVKLVTMPGVLNPSWKLYAKAFYAAEVMGVSEKFHQPLFQTIHQQGRKIKNQDALIRFIESQGIDSKQFLDAMNSMSVTAKVARAEQLGRQYGVTGVPALMVGGKYRVLGGGIASYEEMFEVVDFLAEKVRQEQ